MAYEDTLRQYLEAAIPPWKPIPPVSTDTTISNLAAPVAAGLTSPPAPVQGPVMPASAMAGPPPAQAFQLIGSTGTKTPEGRTLYKNNQGGVSSEYSITVTDPRINNGLPTNIPSIYGGKILGEEESIRQVVNAGGKDPETGRNLPAFSSIEQAEQAARTRSGTLGLVPSSVDLSRLGIMPYQGQASEQTVDPMAAYQQQIADLIGGYAGQAGGVMELQKKAAERKKQVVEPALQAVEAQAKAKPIPLPQQLPEPPRPDVSPRPFGTTEGKNALQAIVAGLSGIVTSLAGLRSPIGAMNAMTGAMEGWAEGDATRAAREWQKYEAEVQKMQRENAKFIEQYELARVARADDMGAAQALLQASLIREKQEDYAVQVGMTGMDQTGKIIDMAQKNLLSLQNFAHKKVLDEIKAMETQNKLATGLLTRQLLGEKVKAAQSGILDDSTLHDMAVQYLTGDTSVKQNIGRGIQGPQNITRLNQMIYQVGRDEMGLSPQDIAANIAQYRAVTAGTKSLATRLANVDQAIKEAEFLIPPLLEASKGVPRTESPLFNRALQSAMLNLPFDQDIKDNVIKMAQSANSLLYVYARGLKGGTPTVSDLEEARKVFTKTYGERGMEAAVDQMRIELKAAKESGQSVMQEFPRAMMPGAKPTEAAPGKTDKEQKPLSLNELLDKYK